MDRQESSCAAEGLAENSDFSLGREGDGEGIVDKSVDDGENVSASNCKSIVLDITLESTV